MDRHGQQSIPVGEVAGTSQARRKPNLFQKGRVGLRLVFGGIPGAVET